MSEVISIYKTLFSNASTDADRRKLIKEYGKALVVRNDLNDLPVDAEGNIDLSPGKAPKKPPTYSLYFTDADGREQLIACRLNAGHVTMIETLIKEAA